jgi:hypothetical protein
MQAAAPAPGGALRLQFPFVSQDPPLELVHVSPEHPTAPAGAPVATKPITAAPLMVPIAAIAISARTPIQDLVAKAPPEFRLTEDICASFFPPHADASSTRVEHELDKSLRTVVGNGSNYYCELRKVDTINPRSPEKVRRSHGQ